MPGDQAATAERYLRFARVEARGRSPTYVRLAAGVAADQSLLDLLERVPPAKRQPNLLFATVRYLGHEPGAVAGFRAFVLEHADEVVALLETRRTQTNEVGRCAALLPVLALLPEPLALIEVGASGGLCLLPDRYGYDYGGRVVGDRAAGLVVRCDPRGPVPIPEAVPRVVWRRGIDLAPVDVRDDAAVRWLECCVWPDQPYRLERLRAAIGIARQDPPPVVAGDLLEVLPGVVAAAPAGATAVVFHSAVLGYLPPARRDELASLVPALGVRWVSNEGEGVLRSLPGPGGGLPVPEGWAGEDYFVLGLDGRTRVGRSEPHGAWLEWGG